MRYKYLAIPIITGVCITIGFGQLSHQTPNDLRTDPYGKLLSIVNREAQALNQTNQDLDKIAAINKEGLDLLSGLPLSEEEKTQFLFEHINQELLEAQKRELLLKMMLKQLAKQKVHPNQFQSFIPFLTRGNFELFDLPDALLVCLVTVEDRGTFIFSNAPSLWGPVLESNLKPRYTGTGILADYMLESASKEHWQPFGNSYFFNSLSVREGTEMIDAMRAAQKQILAKRYIEEKFQIDSK